MLSAPDLTVTQRKVLIVLGKHENEYLTTRQVVKESGVNAYQVKQAIFKFMDNDMVFINSSGIEESVKMSPDDMEVYNQLI